MICFANRATLDTRRVLTRIHNWLQTQVTQEGSPVEQVRYHPSKANKIGVRATVTPETVLRRSYPVADAELQVSFAFPQNYAYDFYAIQLVESDREFMLGWHQDDTHMDLGKCHLQLDYQGDTVQRAAATVLDVHPLNVFDQRLDDLVDVLDAVSWEGSQPYIPSEAVR